MIPNPLRYEAGAANLLKEVSYVGFEQRTSMTYADAQSDFRPVLSIWDAVEPACSGEYHCADCRQNNAQRLF